MNGVENPPEADKSPSIPLFKGGSHVVTLSTSTFVKMLPKKNRFWVEDPRLLGGESESVSSAFETGNEQAFSGQQSAFSKKEIKEEAPC